MVDRVRVVASDLQRVFGSRLQSLVAYGPGESDDEGVHTLALIDQLSFQDLAACVPLVPAWQKAGCAVPLLLTRDEFVRTLDVFPIEYGGIIERHAVILGKDPFTGLRVNEADLRRACEQQVKSHLIHLREGFLENGHQPAVVARMIAASAPPLQAILDHLDRLDPGAAARAGLGPELLSAIASADATTIADPSALLVRYLDAVEHLWEHVDRWRLER